MVDGNDAWCGVGEGSAVGMMDYEGEMKVREGGKHLDLGCSARSCARACARVLGSFCGSQSGHEGAITWLLPRSNPLAQADTQKLADPRPAGSVCVAWGR